MSMMNIAGTQSVDDPEYRYKMPRLQAKIEGRGNGIKTLVVNCADIATSLHRSTAEVCKFFGCELGAQSKYDEKTDRAIVNGAFEAGQMQQHLSKYIEGFVLCPGCRLPETKYKFKGQLIFHKCYACGAVEPVDMNHKLTTFIFKEHTAAKRSSKDGKTKKDKKKEKKEKKVSRNEPEDESATKEKKKEKKEKKDKKEKHQKDKKKKHHKEKSSDKGASGSDDEDEVVWHTDLSAEAVAARAAEAESIEAAATAAMEAVAAEEVVATLDNLHVDDENALDSTISNLKRFLSENHSTSEIFDELCRQQTYSALPVTDRLVIFFRSAFTDQMLVDNQAVKYAPVLEKIIDGQHSQYQLLALVEHFCAVKHPKLLNSYPILLKILYDEDLLEEDCLVSWATNGVRKEYAHWEVTDELAAKLKNLLQPFIEWLENAEEEESEDESD
ncbi:eukaryotic translation initiation factor 5 [Plasmopara halstedii]|uniref:Eukaryotic translation initiation factor 5 n=1 Tax=Plasmopara halstedii TaxID=4781 RepID=A0A0P1B415_PLAHL|nr:eukaryotic translation initiation factor 5 [Plasmopara halstedii]CEG48285.1 eukaryotic translation initiation factor 5 [Plasmopara halstedii]|eukprot:XP_024584654.1 eukaryotic translation initiation factor 5 [Plasmopara halstedii]